MYLENDRLIWMGLVFGLFYVLYLWRFFYNKYIFLKVNWIFLFIVEILKFFKRLKKIYIL